MQSLHPRCAQHGLAVAPDGLCVLCRRQGTSPPPGAANPGYIPPLSAAPSAPDASGAGAVKLAGIVGLLLLVAVGAGLALDWSSGEQSSLQPTAASARLSEAAYEDPKQRELDKAKAADLAASLKMLDRAEAERVQKQQLAAAEAETQRNATRAAREQEELARDRARHDAVAHDLDMQAFQKQRGNVQITMYSTDWCGVCDKARAYMRDKRIPFKDFDIEQDEQARNRAHALNPRGSVPTITIDKELLIGFSADALELHISRAARARKL